MATAEARLQRLEQDMRRLDRRVRALEAGYALTEVAGEGGTVSAAAETPVPEGSDVSMYLSLVGRTFLVFGGAFLLRALTDSGQLPRGGGIAVGVAYAVAWFLAADRAAGRMQRASSLLHGVTGVAIGYPLLWEASTRFGFLAPRASAAALAGLTGLAFAIAWRRRQELLAGLALLGVIVTASGLIGATGQFVPYAALAIAIGVATLWLGYDRDWYWLRWPAALVANGVVAGMALPGLSSDAVARPGAVMGVQVALFATYAGSVAVRTLGRRRVVIPFEVVQTLAALAVGLGGALAMAHASGAGQTVLGVASLVLGTAAYAAAVVCWRVREDLGANFYFYAALALALTLVGCVALLSGTARIVTLASMALAAVWLGRRVRQPALWAASAAYCVVAASLSALPLVAAEALVHAPAAEWSRLGVAGWVVLLTAVGCLAIVPLDSERVPAQAATGPRMVLALLVVLGLCGVIVTGLAPHLAGTPPAVGVLATLRTGVLAGGAVLLAWASRYRRTLEFGWLLYPVLVGAALKLVVEDFRYSEPATLFLALGLFGAALLATARLVRRTNKAVPTRHG